MRSTIHLTSAADATVLFPLLAELQRQRIMTGSPYGRRLGQLDLDDLRRAARQLVAPEVAPRRRRVGPVEGFFARAKGDLSEFMLIYAHVTQARGAWPALFQPDLPPAATIFRRSPPEQIEAALHRVETGEAEILSVHSSQMDRLDQGVQARLCAIWRARGLPDDLFRQGD